MANWKGAARVYLPDTGTPSNPPSGVGNSDINFWWATSNYGTSNSNFPTGDETTWEIDDSTYVDMWFGANRIDLGAQGVTTIEYELYAILDTTTVDADLIPSSDFGMRSGSITSTTNFNVYDPFNFTTDWESGAASARTGTVELYIRLVGKDSSSVVVWIANSRGATVVNSGSLDIDATDTARGFLRKNVVIQGFEIDNEASLSGGDVTSFYAQDNIYLRIQTDGIAYAGSNNKDFEIYQGATRKGRSFVDSNTEITTVDFTSTDTATSGNGRVNLRFNGATAHQLRFEVEGSGTSPILETRNTLSTDYTVHNGPWTSVTSGGQPQARSSSSYLTINSDVTLDVGTPDTRNLGESFSQLYTVKDAAGNALSGNMTVTLKDTNSATVDTGTSSSDTLNSGTITASQNTGTTKTYASLGNTNKYRFEAVAGSGNTDIWTGTITEYTHGVTNYISFGSTSFTDNLNLASNDGAVWNLGESFSLQFYASTARETLLAAATTTAQVRVASTGVNQNSVNDSSMPSGLFSATYNIQTSHASDATTSGLEMEIFLSDAWGNQRLVDSNLFYVSSALRFGSTAGSDNNSTTAIGESYNYGQLVSKSLYISRADGDNHPGPVTIKVYDLDGVTIERTFSNVYPSSGLANIQYTAEVAEDISTAGIGREKRIEVTDGDTNASGISSTAENLWYISNQIYFGSTSGSQNHQLTSGLQGETYNLGELVQIELYMTYRDGSAYDSSTNALDFEFYDGALEYTLLNEESDATGYVDFQVQATEFTYSQAGEGKRILVTDNWSNSTITAPSDNFTVSNKITMGSGTFTGNQLASNHGELWNRGENRVIDMYVGKANGDAYDVGTLVADFNATGVGDVYTARAVDNYNSTTGYAQYFYSFSSTHPATWDATGQAMTVILYDSHGNTMAAPTGTVFSCSSLLTVSSFTSTTSLTNHGRPQAFSYDLSYARGSLIGDGSEDIATAGHRVFSSGVSEFGEAQTITGGGVSTTMAHGAGDDSSPAGVQKVLKVWDSSGYAATASVSDVAPATGNAAVSFNAWSLSNSLFYGNTAGTQTGFPAHSEVHTLFNLGESFDVEFFLSFADGDPIDGYSFDYEIRTGGFVELADTDTTDAAGKIARTLSSSDTQTFTATHDTSGSAKTLVPLPGATFAGNTFTLETSFCFFSDLLFFGSVVGTMDGEASTSAELYNVDESITYSGYVRRVRDTAYEDSNDMQTFVVDTGFASTADDSNTITLTGAQYFESKLGGKDFYYKKDGEDELVQYTVTTVYSAFAGDVTIDVSGPALTATETGTVYFIDRENLFEDTQFGGAVSDTYTVLSTHLVDTQEREKKVYVRDIYDNYADIGPDSFAVSSLITSNISYTNVGLLNRGETQSWTVNFYKADGSNWGTIADLSYEVIAVDDSVESSGTTTYSGGEGTDSYVVGATDIAQFNTTGSAKLLKMTFGSYTYYYTNAWRVSNRLRVGDAQTIANQRISPMGTVYNLQQTTNATWYVALADGGAYSTTLYAEIYDANDVLEHTDSDVTTAQGLYTYSYAHPNTDLADDALAGSPKKIIVTDNLGNTSPPITNAYFLTTRLLIGSTPGSDDHRVLNYSYVDTAADSILYRNRGESHTFHYYVSFADGTPFDAATAFQRVGDDINFATIESTPSSTSTDAVTGRVQTTYAIPTNAGALHTTQGLGKFFQIYTTEGNKSGVVENAWYVSSLLLSGSKDHTVNDFVNNTGADVSNLGQTHGFEFYLMFARGEDVNNGLGYFEVYDNTGPLDDSSSFTITGGNGYVSTGWIIPPTAIAAHSEEGSTKDLIAYHDGNYTETLQDVFAVSSLLKVGSQDGVIDNDVSNTFDVYNLSQTVDFNGYAYFVSEDEIVSVSDLEVIVYNTTDGVGLPEVNVTNETTDANGFFDFSYVVADSTLSVHDRVGDLKSIRIQKDGNYVDVASVYGVSDLLLVHRFDELAHDNPLYIDGRVQAETTTTDDGLEGRRNLLNVGETVRLEYYTYGCNGQPMTDTLDVNIRDAADVVENNSIQNPTGAMYSHTHLSLASHLSAVNFNGSPKRVDFIDTHGNYGESYNSWRLSSKLRVGSHPYRNDGHVTVRVGSSGGALANNSGALPVGLFNMDAAESDPWVSTNVGYARGTPYANKTLTREVRNVSDGVEDTQTFSTSADGQLSATYAIDPSDMAGSYSVNTGDGYESMPTYSAKHLTIYDSDNTSDDTLSMWGLTTHLWVDAHHQRLGVRVDDTFNPYSPFATREDDTEEMRGYIRNGASWFGWGHVMGVRMDREIDTSGGAVTLELRTPSNTLYSTTVLDTGADGWTETSWNKKAIDLSPTAHGWRFDVEVDYDGNHGKAGSHFDILSDEEAWDIYYCC